MAQLPIRIKKYYPEGISGANVTLTYWYEPQDLKQADDKGGIGVLISLMGPDEFSGERTTKFMWDSFTEAYYGTAGGPVEGLRSAVRVAQQRLIELIRHENGVSEQGVDLNVLAVAICEGKMHCARIGTPSAVLARDGEVVNISDMLPSYSGVGYREEVSVGSFELDEGDIVIVSTPKLVESFLGVLAGGDKGEVLSSWDRVVQDIELFSDNLTGNQYLWLIGYGAPDVMSDAVVEQEEVTSAPVRSDLSPEKVSDDTADMGKDNEIGEDVHKEAVSPETTPETYTNGGISGMAGKAKKIICDGVWPKVRKVISSTRVKDRVSRAASSVRDRNVISTVKRGMQASMSRFKLGRLSNRPLILGQPRSGFGSFFGSKYFIPAVIIVMISLIGLYAWKQREERQRVEALESDLAVVEQQIDDINTSWEETQDRAGAVTALADVSVDLNSIEQRDTKDQFTEKIAELDENIQVVDDRVNFVSPLSEDLGTIEILTDLYLKIGEGVEIMDIDRRGTALFLVDKTSHAVYRYTPEDDVIEQIANSADVLKDPAWIAIGDTVMFVYDREVGIVTLDMSVSEPSWAFTVRPELSARTVGDVTEIAAFSDNIYLLKRDEARVLKSYPAGEGYSYPEEYFRNGSLDKAIDILIDGNIFVLSDAAEKVYKFFGGKQDTLSLSGMPTPLGALCCGATNIGDTNNLGEAAKLYVFDAENERLVTFEKPTSTRHAGVAVMVRQYVYRGERDVFKNVKDFVVDKDERVVYLLDGTMVLKVLLENE